MLKKDSVFIVTKQNLYDAGDAIREKTGDSDPIPIKDIDDAIDSIETGITPSGTIQIAQNGQGIDVTQYANADVSVPNTYTQADEGKVVDNGALVAQTSESITQNGVYDTTKKNSVTVNVSDSSADLIERSVTSIYNAQATKVGSRALSQYTTLISVNLPAVTELGTYALDGCASLESLSAPLVTIIGEHALQYCSKLVSLNFPVLTKVANNGVSYCDKLESFEAPLLNEIGNDGFDGCKKLKNIKFDALNKLPYYGFKGCSALESVDLAICSEIAYRALYQCSALSALILRKTDSVCALSDTGNLQNTPIASGTGYIYVPAALKSTYEAATNWVTYAAQFRALEDYTVDGTTTGALDPTKV